MVKVASAAVPALKPYEKADIRFATKADFEKGLSRLIENAELRQQIGRNAFESVERFDVRNIVCEWKDLFQKILG